MDDREYLTTQDALVEMCKDVLMLDLAGFVRRMDEAEAAGPMLDPTAWIRGRERFGAIRRVAVAFLAARGMADELRQVFMDEIRRDAAAWAEPQVPK